MNIPKPAFALPVMTTKMDNSMYDKFVINSHDKNGNPWIEERRISTIRHSRNVKIKFFIAGYRERGAQYVDYVGEWVELECYEYHYVYPTEKLPNTYFIGFYPYIRDDGFLSIRFVLTPSPNKTVPIELYIEKVVMTDSEFNSEESWFNDPDIIIVPNPDIPIDPVVPIPPFKGLDNYKNTRWLD